MSASGLAAHLSPAELGQRYRAARSPIERSHLQVVWLPSRGRSEREVARVTGYGRRWVGEVARRYEEGGPDGLGDRRRGNAGARPLLGAEDEAALRAQIDEARARVAEVPAEVVVINHAMGLYELAAIHLSAEPPDLIAAALAIDAFACLVEGLGDRLGPDVATLRDALAQIRMAFVQIKQGAEGAEAPAE